MGTGSEWISQSWPSKEMGVWENNSKQRIRHEQRNKDKKKHCAKGMPSGIVKKVRGK